MPYLELAHLPATPIRTLERAVEIGTEEGLRFVYLGNVPGHAGENTGCPNCKRLLVRRTGYEIEDVALRGTFCAMCGANVNVRTSLK
jgi:pyruvate formate lyase activating enzyme